MLTCKTTNVIEAHNKSNNTIVSIMFVCIFAKCYLFAYNCIEFQLLTLVLFI